MTQTPQSDKSCSRAPRLRARSGCARTGRAELSLSSAPQTRVGSCRSGPWRFSWRPEDYEVFYDRLAEAATRVQGDPSRYAQNREKYRLTARAPLLLVAAAKIDTAHKVAPIEQAFAAAGATQLVLNAAHALGYQAFLFSGAGVFDTLFKARSQHTIT